LPGHGHGRATPSRRPAIPSRSRICRFPRAVGGVY
jgi:hypothetical protein